MKLAIPIIKQNEPSEDIIGDSFFDIDYIGLFDATCNSFQIHQVSSLLERYIDKSIVEIFKQFEITHVISNEISPMAMKIFRANGFEIMQSEGRISSCITKFKKGTLKQLSESSLVTSCSSGCGKCSSVCNEKN